MDIEEELKKIIEDNDDESWQTRSIKALALCMIEQRSDMCVIKKQLNTHKWLLGLIFTILLMILAQLMVK